MTKERPAHRYFWRSVGRTVVLPFILAWMSWASPAESVVMGWTPTGSMGAARTYHTAILLPNGQVLVTGGGSPLTTSAELNHPAAGTFSPTGSMGSARYDHTATLLPGGKVLVAEGRSGVSSELNSAELYDPATGAFSPTGPMGTARYSHTTTLLDNGKVLIAGGFDA